MTLLDTIISNSLDTTTVAASLYTTSETCDEDTVSTSAVCSVLTLLDNIEVPKVYMVNQLSSYVETMSDEELAKGIELLEDKEQEFDYQVASLNEPSTAITTAKTLVKANKQQ
ncbi:MAG: hypothetical protein Q4F33_04570 [Mycoplasmatota bacterium]|nr:hypothetical protein [Mycoplasmatota bacterium]